jgi:hypothetical protein
VLVAASGYCDDDSIVLAELDSDLELQEDYGESLLIPDTPMRQGTLLGDSWLLEGGSCNYLISSAGALTEVCEDRVAGYYFLESIDDDNYLAYDYGELARYGAGSPSLGDSPTWVVVPPDTSTYDYTFSTAEVGPSGSAFVSGSRRTISSGTYMGYMALYTAGGNLADSLVDGTVTDLDGLELAPDDTIVAWGTSPSPTLLKYDNDLNAVWTAPLPGDDFYEVAIDSVGDIVCVYRTVAGAGEVAKLDPGGTVTKWTTPVTIGYRPRIAVDASDYIYIATTYYDGVSSMVLAVEKLAP